MERLKMSQSTTHPAAASQMVEACRSFLDSLTPHQKTKATYDYMDGERLFWYYPPLNRHGLPLRDMEPLQRELAYRVMATGLTDKSYEQAKLIIEHEDVLGPLEKEQDQETFVRDPHLYYFTVFGEPGDQDPWGWRAEGHHVSLHFSIWAGQVISVTPFFFGANPAEVRKGPKEGLRILGEREDLAFELMDSLDSGQRSKVVIYDRAPWDILTFNSSKASLPYEEGLPGSQLSGTQTEMMMALITDYVTQVRSASPNLILAEMGVSAASVQVISVTPFYLRRKPCCLVPYQSEGVLKRVPAVPPEHLSIGPVTTVPWPPQSIPNGPPTRTRPSRILANAAPEK